MTLAEEPRLFALASGVLTHNSMPESVEDRPGSAVEYVFLFSKSPAYFYDAQAVKVPFSDERQGNPGSYIRTSHADKGGANERADLGFIQQAEQGGWNADGAASGRNRRNSDWFFESWQGLYEEEPGEPLALVVNIEPYRGAHFATFPTRLVSPMILAGTSEKGCCPKCGEPWRRIVEKERRATRPGADTKVAGTDSAEHGNRDPERHITETVTVGWEAGCKCENAGDPVPAVVCDIFNGSGTTGAVARSLSRRYIGFELSEEYAEMARHRIGQGATKPSAAAAAKTVKPCKGQTSLFVD